MKQAIQVLILFLLGSGVLAPQTVFAEIFPSLKIYEGTTLRNASIEEAMACLQPGSVVVLGEEHGTLEQAHQQLQILQHLKSKGLQLSLGMEFFEYPQQELVNQYRKGELSENDFLGQIMWGKGFSFDAYREQVTYAGLQSVLALNVPRGITSKIAKTGVLSLSPEERQMLPDDFTRGNDGYFERFKLSIGHTPPPEKLDNYFMAQSAWDDTMATQAVAFLKRHPDQVLVIIVGEFHVQYGGGLPDRLKARGVNQVRSISLVNLWGLSEQEELDEMQVSSSYGPRADFIWTSRIPRKGFSSKP